MESVGEQTRLYQAALEAERVDPDDEELRAEVERARKAMEVAWLEHTAR